jgi:hypothetical protein
VKRPETLPLIEARFTPPTIEIQSQAFGAHTASANLMLQSPSRMYTAMDATTAGAEVQVLEDALHAEWAMLQRQRALVRAIAAELRARRAAPATTTPTTGSR